MIYTHVSVDLDAASTVALWCHYKGIDVSEKTVTFIPSESCPDMQEDDVALDIYAGGKGIKGGRSAFSKVLATLPAVYKAAFDPIAQIIDVFDSTGVYPKLPGYNSATLVDAFLFLKCSKLNDLGIVWTWKNVVDGVFGSYNEYVSAKKAADTAEKEMHNVDVPIIRNSPRRTVGILFSRGYDFVVYENGNNLGVVKNMNSDTAAKKSLLPLRHILPTWFHHDRGFLSCWGSETSPKSTPPEMSAEQLADLVSALK